MEENLEKTALDIERLRAKIDLRMRREELRFKREELELKRTEGKKSRWSSPLLIAVITGFLGLIGTGVINIIQNQATADREREKNQVTAELEQKKAQSSLILKAIETGDSKAASKNLLYLLDLKLIDDSEGKIAKLRENPDDAPVLSSSGTTIPVPHTVSSLKAFFDEYKTQFEPLDQEKIDALTLIFNFIEHDKEITDIRYVAYILATIKWETANRFVPIVGNGGDNYYEKKYGANTSLGKSLGNIESGDGARYKERGYSALLGKNTYQSMNEQLGLKDSENDLIKYPDKALDPVISYRIISQFMKNGNFDRYIKDDKTDYENARKIMVGGHDRGTVPIAAAAKKFEVILRNSLESGK